MSIRDDIKRPARRASHDHWKVPALYFATPAGDATPVGVRVHTDFKAVGDLAGSSPGWAEIQDTTPRLIFQISEKTPEKGALVSVAAGEVYQIDNVRKPDDEFQTAEVIRLSAAQVTKVFPAGQPVPS